jgi:hypothetical protein
MYLHVDSFYTTVLYSSFEFTQAKVQTISGSTRAKEFNMNNRFFSAMLVVSALALSACGQPVPSTQPGTVTTGGGVVNTTPSPPEPAPILEAGPYNPAVKIGVNPVNQQKNPQTTCYNSTFCGFALSPSSIGKVTAGQVVSITMLTRTDSDVENIYVTPQEVFWAVSVGTSATGAESTFTRLDTNKVIKVASSTGIVLVIPADLAGKFLRVSTRFIEPTLGAAEKRPYKQLEIK